ncbi:DM13 domain-containing protein [Flavobacterium sp. LS2P90]|uniref:DM13 domain-containing protein n=1 Tax=Flavobacterium xylosi TaxID=3230415 RepID=A0ABW6HWS2_9FLAO
MKTKLLFLPVFLFLFSCEVEGDLTRDLIPVIVDQPSTITKLLGTFAPTSGISVQGKATIFLENNQYKLKLVDFSISSGPDLKVYLSKCNTPTDFFNLGNLNPTTVYSIPQNIEIKDYRFVLIHCQQYNHLFAVAELIKN